MLYEVKEIIERRKKESLPQPSSPSSHQKDSFQKPLERIPITHLPRHYRRINLKASLFVYNRDVLFTEWVYDVWGDEIASIIRAHMDYRNKTLYYRPYGRPINFRKPVRAKRFRHFIPVLGNVLMPKLSIVWFFLTNRLSDNIIVTRNDPFDLSPENLYETDIKLFLSKNVLLQGHIESDKLKSHQLSQLVDSSYTKTFLLSERTPIYRTRHPLCKGVSLFSRSDGRYIVRLPVTDKILDLVDLPGSFTKNKSCYITSYKDADLAILTVLRLSHLAGLRKYELSARQALLRRFPLFNVDYYLRVVETTGRLLPKLLLQGDTHN